MQTVLLAMDALLSENAHFTDVEWFAVDAHLQEIDHAPRAFAS